MKFSLDKLAPLLDGERHGPDVVFENISIDTRTMQKKDCYVAIQGSRFDGHDFVEKAELKGAVAAIVSRPVNTSLPLCIVKNTDKALLTLATIRRQSFNHPVIGITGSCGKTTVKSMIAQILSRHGKVVASQKSFNNHYGVPLTLLGLKDETDYAVIEMGTNRPGEIAELTQIVAPDVAIVTMVAPVHLAGFGTVDAIAREKADCFFYGKPGGTAIINRDDKFFELMENRAGDRKIITFGEAPEADIRASAVTRTPDGTYRFNLLWQGRVYPMPLTLIGRHQVQNALIAVACGVALGLSIERMIDPLMSFKPPNQRLVRHMGLQQSEVIDDSYNANPVAVSKAMEILADMPGKKALVFGEMAELGEDSAQYHRAVGEEAKSLNIDYLLTIGPDAAQASTAFGEGAQHFDSIEELIASMKKMLEPALTVLVKGSRKAGLERVVQAITIN